MPTAGSVHMTDNEASDDEQGFEEDYSSGSGESDDSVEDSCMVEHREGSSGPSPNHTSNAYTIISNEAITKHQDEAADAIVALLGCRRSVAKAVLMFYRWDRERVASDLVDRGAEHIYSQAGVALNNENPAAQCTTPEAPVQCEICFSQVDADVMTTMDCCHAFCNDCWRQHFKAQISEGGRCMAYKCGAACDLDKVRSLLQTQPADLEKFEQACLLSYIEENQNVRICTSTPWCGRAHQVEGDAFIEPEGSCGAIFCFKCGREPHSPCTCHMWTLWDEKTTGDSETRHWIQANTKPCPKCSKLVEKNGGCNHVTCKCGQSFCWHCGQATGVAHTWSDIKDHSCGRYKEEADRRIDAAQRNHKRYMHYFERWKGHADSHNKEKTDRVTLMKHIEEKMEGGLDARDYSWLVRALDQLQVARGVLAPSYPFAYFFFGNEMYSSDFSLVQNQCNQQLFEDQQQMLEAEVERLAALVQRCSDSLTINPEERVKVINSTVSIQERIMRLYDLIENDLYGKLQTCSAQIAIYKPKRNLAG